MHSRPYGVRDAEWSLNADGTAVAGAGEEPEATDPAEPIDAAIERMERMRPQELFETFDDMELSWGPNWSGSLKSLWLGEGEAIGDISVGEELSENLGTEPMHPVLMDLCTGVAFPAFPALRAAEQGVSGLFLPLRYEQVTLKEKMPRRFYCRAKWHTSELDSETQVFDLDYLDRDGRHLGGIQGIHRQAGAARGVAAWARWRHHPAAVHPRLARGADCAGGRRRRNPQRHMAGRRIQRTGGRAAGLHPVRPGCRLRATGPGVGAGAREGHAVRRHRLAQLRPKAEESTAEQITRLEAEIENLLSAVHTAQADNSVKLPGGLWIVTERAVATESGEPVDPVQAALWGLGRTILNEEPGSAQQARRSRRFAGGGEAADRPARRPDRRAGTRFAPRKSVGVPVTAMVA